jgi:hypothetical protein
VDTGRKEDEVGEIIHSDRFYQTTKYIFHKRKIRMGKYALQC